MKIAHIIETGTVAFLATLIAFNLKAQVMVQINSLHRRIMRNL